MKDMMALSRFPIPLKVRRKSPGIKKSGNGEFTKMAVDVPLLCPLGSMRKAIPATIAPTAMRI
jgi:hypothetical protein